MTVLCFVRRQGAPPRDRVGDGQRGGPAGISDRFVDQKLEALLADNFTGIVLDTRKALEDGTAKPLPKAAAQSVSKVQEAEAWTTVLRDRRNALHWGKAKSLVADHAETAALLMGAPIHLGTLEAIRSAC